jgi:hypothetical protein
MTVWHRWTTTVAASPQAHCPNLFLCSDAAASSNMSAEAEPAGTNEAPASPQRTRKRAVEPQPNDAAAPQISSKRLKKDVGPAAGQSPPADAKAPTVMMQVGEEFVATKPMKVSAIISCAATAQATVRLRANLSISLRSQFFTCNPASFDPAEVASWRASLQEDGYVCLRGLLPRLDVMQARQSILDRLLERNLIHPLPKGSSADACLPALAIDPGVSPNFLSDLELHSKPPVAAVLEHPRIVEWLQQMWRTDSTTTKEGDASTTVKHQSPQIWTSQYKWLRAVPKGQCTGFHLDRVYMNGSTPLYSLWLPLGDLSASHGVLVLSPCSHTSAAFASLREGYGQGDAGRKGDGTTSGWVDVREWTEEEVEVSTRNGEESLSRNVTQFDCSLCPRCVCSRAASVGELTGVRWRCGSPRSVNPSRDEHQHDR